MAAPSATDMSKQSPGNQNKEHQAKKARKARKVDARNGEDHLLYSKAGFLRVARKAIEHEEWLDRKRGSFDTGHVEAPCGIDSFASPAIILKIFGATGLAADDWLWTPNTFCVVQFGEDEDDYLSTAVVKNTRDPEWNEAFALPVRADPSLHFRVYDDDSVQQRCLGEATIDSRQIWLGFADKLQLQKTAPEQGYSSAFIFIKVRCCELPEAEAEVQEEARQGPQESKGDTQYNWKIEAAAVTMLQAVSEARVSRIASNAKTMMAQMDSRRKRLRLEEWRCAEGREAGMPVETAKGALQRRDDDWAMLMRRPDVKALYLQAIKDKPTRALIERGGVVDVCKAVVDTAKWSTGEFIREVVLGAVASGLAVRKRQRTPTLKGEDVQAELQRRGLSIFGFEIQKAKPRGKAAKMVKEKAGRTPRPAGEMPTNDADSSAASAVPAPYQRLRKRGANDRADE